MKNIEGIINFVIKYLRMDMTMNVINTDINYIIIFFISCLKINTLI
jgi:hypothetical protein